MKNALKSPDIGSKWGFEEDGAASFKDNTKAKSMGIDASVQNQIRLFMFNDVLKPCAVCN